MIKVWRARIQKAWKPEDLTIPVEIDPSAVKLAECYHDIVSKRPGARTGDKQARIDGWIGQIAFQALLIKRKIPFIPHLPIYSPLDPEYGVPYDFYVERVGKIEAKGTARYPNYKSFMVNIEQWKKTPCDYGVGVKVYSDKKAEIMGWLPRKEIENLPIDDYGTGECYHCLLSEMTRMLSFVLLLEQRRTENAN